MDDQTNPTTTTMSVQDTYSSPAPSMTPPPHAEPEPLPIAPLSSPIPEIPMPGPSLETTTTTMTSPTSSTTSTTTTQPFSSPVVDLAPPLVVADLPKPSETSPIAMQATTVTTTESNTSTPPAVSEEQWPETKPKSQMPQVLGGIAAIILVAGVATAAYFVSGRVSGQQAISPTAPVSEPAAFDPNEVADQTKGRLDDDPNAPFVQSVTVDCSDIPDTAPYGNKCVPTVTLPNGEVTWAPGAIEAIGFE